MTSKVKVHVEIAPTQLDRTRGGAVSGKLYLQVDDSYMPTESWSDLVVPTLTWWMDSALRLVAPDSRVVNRFMDGPYEVVLERRAGEAELRVTFTDGGRIIEGPFVVPLARYLAALRGAVKSVLRDLRKAGVPASPDVSSLETGLQHLQGLEEQVPVYGVR